MTETVPFCPETGVPMRRDTRPMTFAYRDESITFDMPGWYCDTSDESVHTSADMKVSDRMLNLLKARAERLLVPDDIRRIRRKLRLTQVRAGELIGGGPRAFQKYEAGKLLPSKAISNALVLLDANPTGLEILERRHGVPSSRHRRPSMMEGSRPWSPSLVLSPP